MERVSFGAPPRKKGSSVSVVCLLVGFAAFLGALSLAPWRVELSYRWERGSDRVLVEVNLPLPAGRRVPVARFRREKLLDPYRLLSQAQEAFRAARRPAPPAGAGRRKRRGRLADRRKYAGLARRLLRVVWIEDLRWVTEVGTGDAAETGAVAGGIWVVKGSAIAVLSRVVRGVRARPDLRVVPLFDKQFFATELACIFSVTPANIITAGIRWLLARAGGGGP